MRRTQRQNRHIAIVGTGFGGLGMAIALKQAGIDDFTLLEKSDRVGGTWRDNSYPGAACDVESHLYSFSFEPNADWSRKFADQGEILTYLEHCADNYGLYEHIRFNAEVAGAQYDDERAVWRLDLAGGGHLEANVFVTACGQLNRPAWPNIPGREAFRGVQFHSACWNHDVDLAGRRVAVIGTGASAIQFVPAIVDRVAELTLFQRSGAWVIAKPDRAFSAAERARFARHPLWRRAYRSLIYWKNESRALAFTRFGWILELFAGSARRLARRQMADDDKRRRLIPDYKIGCKRILMSNDWYPAVDRSNVRLVTEDIERIEANAVITADGTRHGVDTLIYGTGFKSTDFLAPMRIVGRGGRSLDAAWQGGARAYKGIAVAGFPNLFMLYGPNTNLAHSSIVFMLESQIRYVHQCIEALRERDLASMEVRAERQDRFDAQTQAALDRTVWAAGCASWYRTADGRNTNNWPGFTFSFRRATARVALDDFHLAEAAPHRA